VFIPYYGNFDLAAYSFAKRLISVRVDVSGRHVDLDMYECRLGTGVEVRALGSGEFFEKGGPYTEGPEDPLRFGLFSKAVAHLLEQESEKFDIIHCHDWHAALVPFFLKKGRREGEGGRAVPTVLTIHNLAHQGLADKEIVNLLDLGWRSFTPAEIEFYGKVNILKSGIVSSDAVATVSPNYAREVLDPKNGMGLEGVLKNLRAPFKGILNGIDVDKWNPARDGSIARGYSVEDLEGKKECKAQLQKELGLLQDPDATLIAMVARLTAQKGIDLVTAVVPRLLRSNVEIVVLGKGQKDMEDRLRKVSEGWRERMIARIDFDESLSHRIYAGSDLFMCPSRFEPCGLGAMIAMKYGSIPVARATGGLVDTVVDADRFLKTGSGFVFGDVDPVDFLGALLRGILYHQGGGEWNRLARRVMSRDFSWKNSARKYEALYQEVSSGTQKTN
jgi:starch synthase